MRHFLCTKFLFMLDIAFKHTKVKHAQQYLLINFVADRISSLFGRIFFIVRKSIALKYSLFMTLLQLNPFIKN